MDTRITLVTIDVEDVTQSIRSIETIFNLHFAAILELIV